jgi:trimeric autotransporter adhesin
MKQSYRPYYFLLTLVLLAACQKEGNSPKRIPEIATAPFGVPADTIPDTAILKIKLVKDSIYSDEILLVFNHTARLQYYNKEDGIYLSGNGPVGLASISSDGYDLTINYLPYTPGMTIGLNYTTQTSGAFFLETSYLAKIPANIHIWLKDAYLKDSIDIRAHKYYFNVNKADPNSCNNKRFKLILNN